ncbi:MAG: PrsW family intramembrane metalloprotease [Methanobacteriota archaeon]|nr:MAG: PrsW family intramembrane metalloprotease [Euryarchaeota archaeon]
MSGLGTSLSPFQLEQDTFVIDQPKISMRVFQILALISWTLTLLIWTMGGTNHSLAMRFLVVGFGPFLAFLAFNSIVYLRSYETLSQDRLFPKIAFFALTFGIVSALVSLTLNNSVSIIADVVTSILGTEYNIQGIYILFLGVLVPIIEESAKATPLLILSRSLRKEWGAVEKRVFKTSAVVFMVAVLVGSTFTLLEAYLYIFNTIDFTLLQNDRNYFPAYVQLLIRFSFPLHVGTTVLMGFGIIIVLGRSLNRTPIAEEYGPFLLAFVISVFTHGLWNGSLVFSAFNPLPSINIYGSAMPVFTLGLGFVITVFLILSLTFFPNISLLQCEICGNSHFPPFTQEAHYNIRFSLPSLFSYEVKFIKKSLRYWFRELITGFSFKQRIEGQPVISYLQQKDFENALQHVLPLCVQCGSKVQSDGICLVCRSTPMFLCRTCNYPIPVYAQQCWKCQRSVAAPFSRTMKLPTKLINNISIGLGTFSAVHFITLTFILVGAFFILGFYDEFFSYLFLFATLSICFVVALYWVNGRTNLGAGIAFFRIVFSLTLIDLVLTVLAFTLLGILSPLKLGIPILAFLFWLIFAIMMFFIASKIILDTRIFIQQSTGES